MIKKYIVVLILAFFTLTSCSTKKTIVIIPEIKVKQTDDIALIYEFETNIGNKVYFAFDSSYLSEEAKNQLKNQALWLIAHPKIMVKIEGHCDERGSKDYNLALGLRRAIAAQNFLIQQGVNKDRISVISYGKEKPEVLDHNEQAWKQNRRVVTYVTIKIDTNKLN